MHILKLQKLEGLSEPYRQVHLGWCLDGELARAAEPELCCGCMMRDVSIVKMIRCSQSRRLVGGRSSTASTARSGRLDVWTSVPGGGHASKASRNIATNDKAW